MPVIPALFHLASSVPSASDPTVSKHSQMRTQDPKDGRLAHSHTMHLLSLTPVAAFPLDGPPAGGGLVDSKHALGHSSPRSRVAVAHRVGVKASVCHSYCLIWFPVHNGCLLTKTFHLFSSYDPTGKSEGEKLLSMWYCASARQCQPEGFWGFGTGGILSWVPS